MTDSTLTPTVRCGVCGQPNDAGARFCAECGARLHDATTDVKPPVGGGIQLPVATRVVHVGPGAAALAAPGPAPADPGWLRAESLGGTLAKALVAAAVGVILVVVNRHDPTGSAGIFAMWAWYVAVLYLLTTVVRAVGRVIFKA